jgi:hypothetical protein
MTFCDFGTGQGMAPMRVEQKGEAKNQPTSKRIWIQRRS